MLNFLQVPVGPPGEPGEPGVNGSPGQDVSTLISCMTVVVEE